MHSVETGLVAAIKKLGRPRRGKGAGDSLTIRMPPRERRKAQKKADAEGVSLSQWIRECVRAFNVPSS